MSSTRIKPKRLDWWVVRPHEALLPTAMEIAYKIARNPPLAVQALKAGLRRTTEPDWQDTGRWAIEQITRLRGTDDSKEGVAAFLKNANPSIAGADTLYQCRADSPPQPILRRWGGSRVRPDRLEISIRDSPKECPCVTT